MSKAHIFNEILMARPEVIRIGIAKYMHGKSQGTQVFHFILPEANNISFQALA